jgi:glycosyltransferase involved in cell wall biosynthesis
MSKHKICVIGPSKMFLSGISYYTNSLSNALSEDHDVSVLQLRRLLPNSLFPGRDRIGSRISDIKYSKDITVYDGMDFLSPGSWISAIRFLRENKPSHVVCQWWTSSVAHMEFLLLFSSKMQGDTKLILDMHEVVDPLEERNTVLRLYSKLMGRLMRQFVDSFVLHSSANQELITERYNIGADRIEVIPLGLFDQYKKMNQQEARDILGISEEYVILYFGLIRPYKGVKFLIEAFDMLPEEFVKQSRLLIIGELWEDSKDIKDMIARSKYRDNITSVFKYVSDEDVSKYFSACDVVVLPYTRASQSGVASVAMHFQRPLVVSKVRGLDTSLNTYPGTFFVPPKNPNAIKENLVTVRENEKKRFEPPNIGWVEITRQYTDLMNRL